MKILQVIPYFYPAWRYGGPVRVAYDISKKLVEHGHSVVVYTSDIKSENARVDCSYKVVEGASVFYFKNSSTFTPRIKIFVTPSLLSAVKENIKSFDIVHIHGNRTSQNPILHYFLKKNSVPYVVQSHGGLPRIGMSKMKLVYDLLFGYRILRDASKVIALSEVESQQYRSMGVPDEKIAIIPNGIDLSEYADLPPKGSFKKKFGINEKEKIVIYLGRIHKSKGLDLLADAFSVVSRDIKNVRLVVVGPDDGYTSTFSRRISDLGIEEKVLLTGFVEKRDKLAALIDSDVFVTPRFYGFPMTFLEACLAGCPIITTSDELDWINDNVGYVTPPNVSDLAEAMYKIIFNDELREIFSKNCREFVKSEFSLENVVKKLEQVYREIAEENCRLRNRLR